MRGNSGIKAWAPTLALVGVPILGALLAGTLIPTRIGALMPRSARESRFDTGQMDTNIVAVEAQPETLAVARVPASSERTARPQRSRGFSPVREREPIVEVALSARPESAARTSSSSLGQAAAVQVAAPETVAPLATAEASAPPLDTAPPSGGPERLNE